MKETYSNKSYKDFDDEINLLEIIHVLLKAKWKIISFSAFISIIGVFYSLSLPNIYESKTLLSPSNTSNSISSALGGYAGIAGLAGISIPSSGDDGNTAKAMEKLYSLSFFENNILPNIYLPDLMAIKSWNLETNMLVYDESIYKTDDNTWIKMPSAQESFRAFIGQHFKLSKNGNTGFVTLRIKHQSPYIAKQWAELMVNQINTFYRQKDKLESEKAVSYLNQQIAMANLSEIKEVIAKLLQEETKKLTLIEARKFYVFEYVDPPAVMERKSEPSRASLCILFALLGGMLSIILVLIHHYGFKRKAL